MNAIEDSIKSGRTIVGTSGSPNVDMSILADAGYDFLLFDTQHSPWEIKQLQPSIQALRGKQAAPLVPSPPTRHIRSASRLTPARGASLRRWSTPVRRRRQWCAPAAIFPLATVATPECAASGASSRITAITGCREQRTCRRADDRDQPGTGEPRCHRLGPGRRRPADRPVRPSSSWGCRSTTRAIPISERSIKSRQPVRSAASSLGCISSRPMDPNFFVQKGIKLFTMPWAPWARVGIQNGLAGIKR